MTRIKICGITNEEDARRVAELGADALGFIFVPGSPRYLADAGPVRKMLEGLPPFVATVGVFASFQEAEAAGFSCDFSQVYETGVSIPDTGRVIRAFRIRDESSLEEIATELRRGAPRAILLDAYHPEKLGGSGETFNWNLAREAGRRFRLPVVLAGGLTAENVGEAIAVARPYAVDVSSGVEAEPGRKDPERLAAFMRAVRRADAALASEGD